MPVTKTGPGKAPGRRTRAQVNQATLDVVRAREFQLVGDDGEVRLSMQFDSRGYPRIVVGDQLTGAEGSGAGDVKRIVIGFTGTLEKPGEVWPRVEVQVRHDGNWCSTGIAVVLRDKPGSQAPHPREVFPEICLQGKARIRATLALDHAAKYEPTLTMRGPGLPPAQTCTVTSHGPAKQRSARK